MAPVRSFLFYRRVRGRDTVYGPCTNQVELSENRTWLYLRLASTARFAVTLDWRGVFALIEALETDTALAVPCRHEEHGPISLQVEIYKRKMALSLTVEDSPITVVFDGRELAELVDHLRNGMRYLEATRT
ncbi:hypothetical protein [Actinoalloteichus hymeniacidonis]|uniref:Uncharacterized protein n=1 Tax=Actinoalloteichus hymeniacidonis TaxID=340345 RepID=A0AAC9N1G3_9PSEU|nr:hypothetical protein [Actinoalloteichus hymeniacidonis]AOS65851.1 hypothetical protein TL08_25365 [Actinoalloteichus hymeniacidonis]MBB5906057.1 hypothetical protein [Actinoalloteichus hymeniacidonis]